ncbi:hypothetical protein CAI21_10160 [Alkalilimnicola ehrlichii]|uniref:Rieske domain-containing protein n=1 Tax=Alkalilimnicola ehrlichii TaxID=351052 RepID=A0A3E0WG67_9GAMM|nr:aromatic ring-hydroxylating dioxygenase subunit alpha [Alkalilimnicola ehrlichii]RFA29414.1 hypothetical protein CAI21_10160 [Alkalilimnicola ehrlichii]RFA31932.1 hypothetical protein CAL65_21005 [Alkalilimnicola ehrlichii]
MTGERAALDPVLANDWHPVAAAKALQPGAIAAVKLLGQELAVWRDSMGAVHAWEDRCPHRGTRFSIGSVEDDQLVCAYHAWRFVAGGRCIQIPAQPDRTPPSRACARVFQVREAYGLIWVCLGVPTGDVPPFPEYDDPNLRTVLCGPYTVRTSAPRVLENYVDLAHFPYVHPAILGDDAHAGVADHRVSASDDGAGGRGLLASGCKVWQPQTNSVAEQGSLVEYGFRILRPLTAILVKEPEAQEGFREAISLHVQPVEETLSIAWVIMAVTNFEQSDEQLRAFEETIFMQDVPILENQVPPRLPLNPAAELPVACDRLSVAYRRYLKDLGLAYGVTY